MATNLEDQVKQFNQTYNVGDSVNVISIAGGSTPIVDKISMPASIVGSIPEAVVWLESHGMIDISTIKGKAFTYQDCGDFKKYYDTTQKRNYWVLGYFGGGSLNISEANEVAKDYAKATGVPYDTVKIDEVFSSRRYKGFKFAFSTNEQSRELLIADDCCYENVFEWLCQ